MRSHCVSTVLRAVTVLSVALCVSPARTLGQSAGAERRVSFQASDAGGERLDTRTLWGSRVLIVIFTSSDASEGAARLAEQLDLVLFNDPQVDTVSIADMTGYDNFLMRGTARSKIRDKMAEIRAIRGARRRANGREASPAQVNRWRLIGDFDGRLLRVFGLGEVEDQPIAFVLDGRGLLRGPFRGERSHIAVLEAVERARASLVPPSTPDPATSGAAP